MTISELNDKRRAIDTAAKQLQDSLAQISAVASVMNGLASNGRDKSADTIKTAQIEVIDRLSAVSTAIAAVEIQVYNYGRLLDDVMRKTKLEWPPACVVESN